MNENKVIIYTANDGKTRIDVKLEEETLWLTQAQMCELYQTSKSNVSEHIKHIFEEGELNKESVVRNFRTTAADGKEYLVSHYNLDMNCSWLSCPNDYCYKVPPVGYGTFEGVYLPVNSKIADVL